MPEFDLPIGFAMALAMNEKAMQKFEMMNDNEKKQIIEKTHSVHSKGEMQSLVNSL